LKKKFKRRKIKLFTIGVMQEYGLKKLAGGDIISSEANKKSKLEKR
jgi:hypothetical protein